MGLRYCLCSDVVPLVHRSVVYYSRAREGEEGGCAQRSNSTQKSTSISFISRLVQWQYFSLSLRWPGFDSLTGSTNLFFIFIFYFIRRHVTAEKLALTDVAHCWDVACLRSMLTKRTRASWPTSSRNESDFHLLLFRTAVMQPLRRSVAIDLAGDALSVVWNNGYMNNTKLVWRRKMLCHHPYKLA